MNKYSKSVIGILGGPGSGKSAVSAYLAELGCGIVDADSLNHQVLERQNIARIVADCFGDDILTESGKVDRKKLGAIVFGENTDNKLRQLMDIVHPEIFKLMTAQSEEFDRDPAIKAIVYDVPLLMEVGWHKYCNILIYVQVDDIIRHERLISTRSWSDKLIKSVENFQILLDKKRQISDYIVENNSDIIDLRLQVDKISPKILK